jgi:hypothetical protein
VDNSWYLENVTEIAKDAPYTFYLPSKELVTKIVPGNVVKLMFSCDVENKDDWSAERMWVLVTEIKDGTFKGTLDNDPSYIPDLKYKDIIEFQSKHIMQTDIDDTSTTIVDKFNPRCYVTSEVLNNGFPVHQLYWEQPEESEENYSGWTLTSGNESEVYLNDSSNWHFVSLGAVLNKCDRFISLLDIQDVDHEFVWDEASSEYKKI